MSKLLLVSTFRHLFLGLSLASQTNDDWHVLFIDQKQGEEDNSLYKISLKVLSPFASVNILPIRIKGQSKKEYRKYAFSHLRKILINLKPGEIITGNDRRLEFQYSMHFSRNKLNIPVEGGYVDDGTGSYRNMYDFKKSARFSDKYIDTPVKKLIYGDWYARPDTLGGSYWIDNSYLCFPEIALPGINGSKKLIDGESYKKPEIYNVITHYMEELGYMDCKKYEAGILFVLPHSSIVKELYGSVKELRDYVKKIVTQYPETYVKYHPRELGDPLGLSGEVKLLPSTVPAEMFLACMTFKSVIGDVSTALMSAKWLQPECVVKYIPNHSSHTLALRDIFFDLGVEEFSL